MQDTISGRGVLCRSGGKNTVGNWGTVEDQDAEDKYMEQLDFLNRGNRINEPLKKTRNETKTP
ncbi:MAG: hypothetical protein DVB28_000853 [Verrucomicrobia bacterium]|nr:MAG: hypothetical protein DVB28_000853 [Verrucomicrobiota bacterium]